MWTKILPLVVAVACAQQPVAAQTPAGQPEGVRKIGHEVCALRALVYAEVNDQQGRGISGVEVWLAEDWRGDPEATRTALRLGKTASNGIGSASLCLMESGTYARWTPGDTLKFTFFLLGEGYGFEAVDHQVATEEFLHEANLLGVEPGAPIDWNRSTPKQGAYVIKLAARLSPVVSGAPD